jgi:hypothetical protein
MTIDQLANQDFEHAISRGFWRKILARITGKNNDLLPYDEVREKLPIRGQHYIGLKQVELDKIVGSMGRYHDFDRAFLPIQSRSKGRWVSIDKAHYAQVELPPVELFKLGEIYFVKDGNHRVSVARQRGQIDIDAYVTEIDIPVILTPDLKIDDLQLKKEQAEFLLHTHLDVVRTDARVETTTPGAYARLLEHIAVHRWYMGEQHGAEVPYKEAVASWYDQVYLPLVKIIREHDLLAQFPGQSEADLYLWIMAYQGYLSQLFKTEFSQVDSFKTEAEVKAEAARQLVDDFPHGEVRNLVRVLRRNTWIDELILTQERTIFFEQTRLDEIRPEAGVEATLPGQYTQLLEHISVHRWYLGEQRKKYAPYLDAVASWYENVYRPLVEIIREQDILKEFPGRTETDLYLWIISHRQTLRDEFGSEVPIEQAAEQFTEDFSHRSDKK